MPRLSKLFVDLIAITLPVQNTDTQEHISDFLSNPTDGYVLESAFARGNYLHSYFVTYEDENSYLKAHVQCEPCARFQRINDVENTWSSSTRNWLRIEWNPKKVSHSRMLELFNVLLGEHLEEELYSARLTRIDFAYDLRRANLQSIFIGYDNTKSTIHYGGNGLIETVYIGSRESNKRFIIYDKTKQLKQSGGMVVQGRVRLEVKLKPGTLLRDIAIVSDPFSGLIVKNYVALEHVSNKHTWYWFLDSCKKRGVQAALGLIRNSRNRGLWRKRIIEIESPAWWNLREPWEIARNNAIEDIGLTIEPTQRL